MKNSFDEKILEEANDWVNANEKGDFSGSVSGGCVESAVVRECIGLIKDNKPCKKLEFKVSNESAWEVGLACGGEIAVYLEQVN
jgi:xanthine/CO dehydrogenase XdhC/CoxF family maturation factor